MYRLFRKRRDKPSVMYSVFQKIGNAVDKRQRQLSDYLNTKAERLSTRQLMTGLILFCIVFGSGTGFVIWQSLNKPTTTVRVRFISMPRHTIPTEDNTGGFGLTGKEINNILDFQHYLDSLLKTKEGKLTYDSIRHYRAGLMDSLSLIQKMYHEQLKTK